MVEGLEGIAYVNHYPACRRLCPVRAERNRRSEPAAFQSDGGWAGVLGALNLTRCSALGRLMMLGEKHICKLGDSGPYCRGNRSDDRQHSIPALLCNLKV